MRFDADALALVDAEVERRRAAGEEADRTALMEEACRVAFGGARRGSLAARTARNGKVKDMAERVREERQRVSPKLLPGGVRPVPKGGLSKRGKR